MLRYESRPWQRTQSGGGNASRNRIVCGCQRRDSRRGPPHFLSSSGPRGRHSRVGRIVAPRPAQPVNAMETRRFTPAPGQGSAAIGSMKVETTELFGLDREHQFRWYLTETHLDPEPALELAKRFARAVDHTLDLISRTPAIGRRRFPMWADAQLRSFPVRRPFNRFLVFYRIESQMVKAIRLLEGHRKRAADQARRIVGSGRAGGAPTRKNRR